MKREIKFRAWDGDKKVMYLPEYSDPCDFHIFADGSIVETHEHGYERHELTSRRPDSWVLMQYTGLKDKNGVDIYEGDIIGCLQNGKQLGAIERVEFSYGCFTLRHRNLPIWDFLGISDEFEIEVLGNIFEHPHLLTH